MGSRAEIQTEGVEVSPGERVASRLDFRTIFELEAAYVVRVLRRLSVPEADVEDMAHEVFLAVHRALDSYDPSRPLRPWLFGFAFRVASGYRRKARRETALPDADHVRDLRDGPEALADHARKREHLLAVLDQIELHRRAVFVLHEIDGQTCEEVARALEIPIGTVYSRLRLAREDFQQALRRMKARRVPG
jgi:RNA polymerase sigma-70 factor (ECF subfamily)